MCVRRGPLKGRMLLPTSRNIFIAITIPSLLLTTTLTQSFIIPKNNNNPSTAVRTKTTTKTSSPPPPPSPPKNTLSLSNDNNNNNPLSSLMTGLKSSLFSSSSPPTLTTKNPTLDSTLTSTLPYTWPTIRSTLTTLQTPHEQSFRSSLPHGYGPPSPLHTLRLYSPSSSPKEEPRVTLYRDSASWCPYCQKVWITLEEKRIPYRIEKINMRCYGDKPRSFLKMQPSGNIPVAVIDGVVYNQSNDIMMALERVFVGKKSLSDYGGREERARLLLRLERQLFGAWMYWLTGGGERSKREFMSVLNEVEAELRSTDKKGFFMGDDVTIVDIMYAPFLERMAASLLYFKGFQIRVAPGAKTSYPYVNRWFDAMETLESYQLTKSDYYTHCWDLPPQLGGCREEEEGEVYRRAINGGVLPNGGAASAWELPLTKDNGGIEPDWDWCGDDDLAKREAVERVSFNHENIVMFASRGAMGTKQGFPPVMAPLADPNAIPAEGVQMAVDVILRIICMGMLKGLDDDVKGDMTSVARIIKDEGGEQLTEGVVRSLAYLRDRVGVPRDMRLPAARNLRAHINWALKYIID